MGAVAAGDMVVGAEAVAFTAGAVEAVAFTAGAVDLPGFTAAVAAGMAEAVDTMGLLLMVALAVGGVAMA
jgi:hypothetical protein